MQKKKKGLTIKIRIKFIEQNKKLNKKYDVLKICSKEHCPLSNYAPLFVGGLMANCLMDLF